MKGQVLGGQCGDIAGHSSKWPRYCCLCLQGQPGAVSLRKGWWRVPPYLEAKVPSLLLYLWDSSGSSSKRADLGKATLGNKISRLVNLPFRGSGETQVARCHILHVAQEGPRGSHGGTLPASHHSRIRCPAAKSLWQEPVGHIKGPAPATSSPL